MKSRSARISLLGKVNIRGMLTLFAAILLILPLLAIVMRVNFESTENWIHYRQYLLADSIWNTAILATLTLLLSGIIGVGLAVLVVFFDFPGRRIMKWLFYLPLTIPPYIAAYVFNGLLGYTGFIQKTLRAAGVAIQPTSLDIMNLQGAVLIYTMTLYPYVYGSVRTFLERHSANLIESARVLGLGPIRLVFRVILPLIRVPLTGGLMLLLMEVLSDYGVVRYFNISTLSTLIFNSWFGLGDPSIAIRLSFSIMSMIVLLLVAEHFFQGRRRYHLGSGRGRPVIAIPLNGLSRLVASVCAVIFLTVTFLIPVAQLAHWSWLAWSTVQLKNIVELVLSTVWVSLLSGLAIISISVFFAHSERNMHHLLRKAVSHIVQLGYSIPGAVIAIGTISLFVTLDGLLLPFYQAINPDTRHLILSTSLFMLLLAFTVRYLAVGYNSTRSGFAKIGSTFSEAARTLGCSKAKALFRVELPLLKNALLSGLILTWIDISKELPLTLLLRPFNFNTLASRVYEYANDERIHEASVPALILITLSLIGIAGLTRLQTKKEMDR